MPMNFKENPRVYELRDPVLQTRSSRRSFMRRPEGLGARPPTTEEQMQILNEKWKVIRQEFEEVAGIPFEQSGSLPIHAGLAIDRASGQKAKIAQFKVMMAMTKFMTNSIREDRTNESPTSTE